MSPSSSRPIPPSTLLVWTLHDRVLEQPQLLLRQFEEIRESGFGGVAPWVRCSRYTWNDPLARAALRRISHLCARHRLHLWIGPDPRFVSRELIGGRGLELLLFGDTPRASNFPHLAPASEGSYSIRCSLAPRHVHTLTEVAVEYHPAGIAGLFAIRTTGSLPGRRDILDLTSNGRMFYNARDRYVEAFGADPRLMGGAWQIMAFFHVRTNHFDYSDRAQMERYARLLVELRKEGIMPGGVMWDEPGYTCTYGTLPYTTAIRRGYSRRMGRTIERDLWKLALDSPDGSHAGVRIAYYREIQRSLNDANRRMTKTIRHLWGPGTVSGIHDTWHFESGDMCDMNHGSLDLWEGMKAKTGGFVDLGGIDQLRDPDSPWYDNLAAMSVIAASLGRASSGGYAYNNLWTVGDDGGEGWQTTVMDHCVNVMALFGTRWLAHAYGPVGTIGEERSFLGSPPLPGYPDHSTWPRFPEWNRRLSDHHRKVEHRLPRVNLLVIFPVDALYSMADRRADRAAAALFRLLRLLLDHHYHPDLLSPDLCADGRWDGRSFTVGQTRYQGVIAPFASTQLKGHGAFRRAESRPLFTLAASESIRGGRRCADEAELLRLLADLPEIRPIAAPERSWVSLTSLQAGTMLTLMPSRHGFSFAGRVAFEGTSVECPPHRGLVRILFPRGGIPQLLPVESIEREP